MSESMWSIPDASAVRTPLSIFLEQASLLTRETNGLLRGEVVAQTPEAGIVTLSLRIAVPALENYTIEVLSYSQPIGIYPGVLRSGISEMSINVRIAGEPEFLRETKKVLSSHDVRNLLKAFLAQARTG